MRIGARPSNLAIYLLEAYRRQTSVEFPNERLSGKEMMMRAFIAGTIYLLYLAGLRLAGTPDSTTALLCTYAITGTAAALVLRFGWSAVPGLLVAVCVLPIPGPGPLYARTTASILILAAPIVVVGALRGGTRFEPDLSRASNIAWLAPAALVNALIAVGPISTLTAEFADGEPVAFGHVFLSHVVSIILFAPTGMLWTVPRRRLRPSETWLSIAGIVALAILALSAFTPVQTEFTTIVAVLVVAAVLSVLLGIRFGVHVAVAANVVVILTAGMTSALRPTVFLDGTAELFWIFAGGNSTVTLTVASVIHARDRIEERLRFSDFALYNVGQAIILFDSDAQIRYANRAARHLFGYASTALERMSMAQLSLDWSAESRRKEWTDLVRSRSREWETTAISKDGTTIPLKITSNGIIFESEELVVCFIEDLRRQRQQQVRLLESERTFRALFEESPIPIQRFDARGNLLQINQAVSRLWGIPYDITPKYNLLNDDSIPEEMRAVTRRAFSGEVIQSEPIFMDITHERTDGHNQGRWIQSWYYPLRNEQEEVVEVIVAVFDVTAEREARTELASARALLDVAFEHLPVGAYAYSRQSGEVVLWNRAAEEIFGFDAEQVTREGLGVLDSVVSDATDAPSHARSGSQVGAIVTEHRVQPPDLPARIVMTQQVPIEEGGETLVLTLADDVTAQRRFERELQESEERYRAVVEHQTELIARATIDGRLLFANEAFARFVGSTPEEVVEENIWPTYDDEAIAWVMERKRSLTPGEVLDNVVLDVVEGPGKGRTLTWTLTPFFDDEGNVRETLGVARDVTDEIRAQRELEASEARYRAVVEHQTELIARAGIDGEMLFANEAYARFVGATPDEVVERNIRPGYRPEEIAPVIEARKRLKPGEILEDVTLEVIDGPGAGRTLKWTVIPFFDADGTVRETLGVARDVTRELVAQRELEQSEARYRAVVEDQTEFIARVDRSGRLMLVNDAYCRLVGESRERILKQNLQPVYREADMSRAVETSMADLSPDNPVFVTELQVVEGPRAGRWINWTSRGIFDADGNLLEVNSVGRDVTERRRYQDELVFNAMHDALTGLPNRAALTEMLNELMSHASTDAPVACFFMDLDRFKLINDTLGHQAGDELLIVLAGRLQEAIERFGGFVARLGGDEFVALVSDGAAQRQSLVRIAEELVRTVTAPARIAGGEDVFVGVSIGIVEVHESGELPEDVIRHADMAMYRAKRSVEQPSYAFYERHFETHAVERLTVQRDLAQALRRRELRVFFQPIVRLVDGGVEGLEVLVRWQHPERGLLAPGEFLSVAEESQQILELGWWVLDETLRVCTTWLAAGLDVPKLSINLSPRQFADPELLPRLRALLAERDLEVRQVAFEITEEAFIHPDSIAAENIRSLGQLGLELHVDDFGTGYSSLSYLHRLPASTLKIDRSFVSGLEEGATAPIIEAIVHLGTGLKKKVIAEGVETAEQRAWLIDHGCTLGQGYFFYRPMDEAGTRRLLIDR